MAWTSGTATDHIDLLGRFNTFVTGLTAPEAWVVNRDVSTGAGIEVQREIQYKAPGLAGLDEFFMSFVTYAVPTSDIFNWAMCGQIGYIGANPRLSQPGISSQVYASLWDQPIPYWFVANGRRAVGVMKISTVFQSFYMGAFLPYATPTENPYPMIAAGTGGGGVRWSDTSWSHRAFFDPGTGGCWMHYFDGTWRNIQNVAGISFNAQEIYDNSGFNTWPYGGSDEQRTGTGNMRNAMGTDQYVLTPVEIMQLNTLYSGGVSAPNNHGVYDGVYHITGFSAASEDIIQIGGVDHLVFQNCFRTGRPNYAALKLA